MYNKIEDAILELHDGEMQKNALILTNYINENQMTPKTSGEGFWKIPFNGYYLGQIIIEAHRWYFEIFNYLDFGKFNDEDEEFTNIVYEQVQTCETPCHDECWRAKDVKIFGKEFKSVCSQHSRGFRNPDGKTIEHIKKLIEYSKNTTPYVQQYHPTHL